MGAGLAEVDEAPVGADHAVLRCHQCSDVSFVEGVEDGSATTGGVDLENEVGDGVGLGRRPTGHEDVGEGESRHLVGKA